MLPATSATGSVIKFLSGNHDAASQILKLPPEWGVAHL
jgi:hypothetical protein